MVIIVGLGNPGKEYEKTRHNIGFMIVESLKLKVKSFSDWQNNKKLLSEISKGEIIGRKIILAKPQTFMNLSGKSVKSLIRNYKLEIRNLVVVHDDLDLPLGKIRLSIGRGSAGHKGVESIIKELGTKNFVRFRIGIKPNSKLKTQNSKPQLKTKNLENFVLRKFKKEEEKIVNEVVGKTCEAIEYYLESGLEKAMTKFNV